MNPIKPKNIFVVDDDPMVIESFKDYLTSNWDHKVSIFPTGEECIGHLDENPDIIILDYYLNSVQKDAADGMEVLQFIKVNYPGIRIIMLSSMEQFGFAKQTIEQGAEQYVLKDRDAFDKIAALVNAP